MVRGEWRALARVLPALGGGREPGGPGLQCGED